MIYLTFHFLYSAILQIAACCVRMVHDARHEVYAPVV